jgi:hypothetical protein
MASDWRTNLSSETFVQRLTKRIEDVRRDSKESVRDDRYVKLAFQRLGLDLEKNEDHDLLLRAFCRALHGAIPLKPVGFFTDLILDTEKMASENPTGGRRQAVKRLRTDSRYRQKYGKYTWHTLLKLMDHACDRKKNPDYGKLWEIAEGRPKHKKYSRTSFLPTDMAPPKRFVPPSELRHDEPQDSKPAREKKRTGRRSVRKPASIYPELVWFRGRVCIVESEIT